MYLINVVSVGHPFRWQPYYLFTSKTVWHCACYSSWSQKDACLLNFSRVHVQYTKCHRNMPNELVNIFIIFWNVFETSSFYSHSCKRLSQVIIVKDDFLHTLQQIIKGIVISNCHYGINPGAIAIFRISSIIFSFAASNNEIFFVQPDGYHCLFRAKVVFQSLCADVSNNLY